MIVPTGLLYYRNKMGACGNRSTAVMVIHKHFYSQIAAIGPIFRFWCGNIPTLAFPSIKRTYSHHHQPNWSKLLTVQTKQKFFFFFGEKGSLRGVLCEARIQGSNRSVLGCGMKQCTSLGYPFLLDSPCYTGVGAVFYLLFMVGQMVAFPIQTI